MKKAVLFTGTGVILLGLWAYFIRPNIVNNSASEPSPSLKRQRKINTSPNTGSANKSALRKLLATDNSARCDFTGKEATGAAFVMDNMIRIDGLTGSQAAQFEQPSAIYKENKAWVWDKKNKQGFSFTFPISASEAQTDERLNQAVLADLERYEYSCNEESIDASLFTPPEDVTFMDMSELIESGQ